MRKVSLMIAALALVLGISQCKKQEKPAANGQKQHIELTANNGNDGSKVSANFVSADLNLTWDGDEVITVSGGATGTLDKITVDQSNPSKATFEGDIEITDKSAPFVFTVGKTPDYEGQPGTEEGCEDWIHDNISLTGTDDYDPQGQYSADMELPYAVLKLDVSALGISGKLEIKVGETLVASVTDVTAPTAVFVAVPTDGNEKEYKISIGGKTATKKWPLQPNTFYTKSDGEGGGTGDAFVIEPDAPAIPTGALSGKFSVSADKQVYFSKGNLQYHPKNNKWRFAASQEEVCDKTPGGSIHSAVGYSQNSDTWIDLFGWGTSNYDHNGSGCHPWNTSDTYKDYYPYGTTWGNDLNSSTGMADWGKANATDLGEGWYTLSYSDWHYMLFTRKIKGASGPGKTFARATIKDANGKDLYGLVIFPDDYSGSQSSPLSSIPEGCAFLPCAGHRGKTNVNGYLTSGYYWTSTHHNSKDNYAWNLAISSNQDYVTEFRPNGTSTGNRITQGQSVRLVHDVPAAN